jgi:hypothetical protein
VNPLIWKWKKPDHGGRINFACNGGFRFTRSERFYNITKKRAFASAGTLF